MKERVKNIMLFLVITILIFLIVFISLTKPIFKLYYNNEEVGKIVEIELGEEFEPTIYTKYLKKSINSNVTKIGDYDNNKVGEYKVVYQLNKIIYKMNKTVYVKVVDNISPIISLNGEINQYACSLKEYKEEGYYAYDNYDGDLTDKVNIEYSDNRIIYSVFDSSNNLSKVERIINISDNESPRLKLINGDEIFLKINDKYIEYGVNTSDNCDSKLDEVKIKGEVDTSKEGKYELSYSVCDTSNNCTNSKRNIYIYNPEPDLNNNKNGVIYLTFDDGPSKYTSHILDVLSAYDIKATFFVTNSGSDSLIKREYDEGHSVALHTSSHNYKKIYSSDEAFYNDLKDVSNRVYRLTNEKSMIMRFPGGSSNTISKNYNDGIMTRLTKSISEMGYHYFDWNVSIEDAGSCSKKSDYDDKKKCVYNYFVKGISKGKNNIVLMHDVKSYTADTLEDMIKYAIKNGYSFSKITMDTKEVHHSVNN